MGNNGIPGHSTDYSRCLCNLVRFIALGLLHGLVILHGVQAGILAVLAVLACHWVYGGAGAGLVFSAGLGVISLAILAVLAGVVVVTLMVGWEGIMAVSWLVFLVCLYTGVVGVVVGNIFVIILGWCLLLLHHIIRTCAHAWQGMKLVNMLLTLVHAWQGLVLNFNLLAGVHAWGWLVLVILLLTRVHAWVGLVHHTLLLVLHDGGHAWQGLVLVMV